MIRSVPPASAHLADRPVPAPAPMITPPPSSVARSLRARLVARHAGRLRRSSSSFSAIASANASSLMLQSSSTSSTSRAHALAQRLEQRRVRLGVVERLALGVDQRDAAQRHEQRHRPASPPTASRDPPAELRALLGRRAHERDRRVVHVEVALLELRRHRLARAEVDHVERAERDDLRQPGAARRPRAGRARRRARRRRGRRTARSSWRRARRRGSRPSTSASIARPPVPVAWNTSTS